MQCRIIYVREKLTSISSIFSFCLFRYLLVIKDWFYRDHIFWLSNFWIPVVVENATFRCRNMPKKREIARHQRRTAGVVNEKATTAERREKERRSRPQRTMCVGSKMLEVGENRTETGPVARSLLLPGYGASCWIRNESFWMIALNNVCVIEARGLRPRNFCDGDGGGGGLISGGMIGDAERAGGRKAAAYFAQDEARVLGSRDASSTRYPESWAVLTPKFIIGGGRTSKRELAFDEDKWKIEIKRLWMLIIEILWESLFSK